MRLTFKTEKRGYSMLLEKDMYGAFVLWRRWYGLHNRKGGMKRQVFIDEEGALRELRRVAAIRKRHGYVVVTP